MPRTLLLALALAILTLAPIARAEVDPALVGHWTFDEAEGDVVHDRSGNDNHGAIKGAAKWVRGAFGTALEFSGESTYVDCGTPDSLNIAKAGTVMVWCKPITRQGGLMNWSTGGAWKDERLVLAINTWRGADSTSLYIERHISYAGFGAPPTDRWTHLAFTFDGLTVSAYLNGLLIHATAQSGEPRIKDVPLWIGRCQGLGEQYFHGLLDEARVYNRPLSGLEIMSLYKQDARGRGRDLSVFKQVGLEAVAHADAGWIVATLDTRGLQPLPDGARLGASLLRIGRSKLVKESRIPNDPAQPVRRVTFNIRDAPPGRFMVRAVMRAAGGDLIVPESHQEVAWPGRSEAFKGIHCLNSLCWELVNVRPKRFRRMPSKHDFTLPYDRWVLIRTTARVGEGGRLSAILDGARDSAVIAHTRPGESTLEAMRYLAAGPHVLRIERKGSARLTGLIVRAVPALQHAFYGSTPHIRPYGPYDWSFLKKHILPHVNVIIGTSPKEEHIREWTDAGREWIAIINSARAVKAGDENAVDKAYKIWTGSPGFTHPLMSGIIVDEFAGDEAPIYKVYTQAVAKIYANPKFKGRAFNPYTYGEGFSYAENPKEFAQLCLDNGGYMCRERYLQEQPTREAARHLIESTTRGMATWEKGLPGVTRRMVAVYGYMSQPTESLNINPGVDFKVFMDMQIGALATHPAFFGLGGIQEYHSSYSDEESVRWAARLYRHYALEGNTEPVSADPYVLTHIHNPDFRHGVAAWKLKPAEPGAIQPKRHPGISWLEGRYPRTQAGDTFLRMKRSAAGPNAFSQEIRDLQPGRLYSLKMISADYQDLVQEKSNKKPHAVTIRLDDVDVMTDLKKNFQFTFPNCYAHHLGKFDARHNYWMNYHWRVFRARAATARLSVSDWKSGEEPGGPIGQELMYNFIEIQPYIGD